MTRDAHTEVPWSAVALEHVQDMTAECMDKIVGCFVSGAKITVIVRIPDEPEQDFCMTSDEPVDVIALLKRRIVAIAKAEGSTP